MKTRLLIFSLLALIFQNCKKSEPLMPIAEFTTNMYSISQNDTVKFINSSLNATSYLWHFTGGTPEYSTEKNPKVTYKRNGRFAVLLKVSNEYGSDSIKKDSLITVDYTYVGFVNNGIIYRNLTGDSIFKNSFKIDINNDGENDIDLNCSNSTVCGGSSATYKASIQSLNNNVLILNDSISPKILTLGDTLENQVGWNSNTYTLFYHANIWCANPPINSQSGTWFNIVRRYIGIKVNDKFGWIQIGTAGSGGWEIHDMYGTEIIVYDYGIEK